MNYTQHGMTTDRATRLTPNDAGYVVSHADVRSGERLETAIALTTRLELEIEDRGHEMVLAERAKETHRCTSSMEKK